MKISELREKVLSIIRLIDSISEKHIMEDAYTRDYFFKKIIELGGWMFKLRDAKNPSLAKIKAIKIKIGDWNDPLINTVIWYRNEIVHKYFYWVYIDPVQVRKFVEESIQLKSHLQHLKDELQKLTDENLESIEGYVKARKTQELLSDFTVSDYLAIIINEVSLLDEILKCGHCSLSIVQLYRASAAQHPDLKVLTSFSDYVTKDEQLFDVLELHYLYITQTLIDYNYTLGKTSVAEKESIKSQASKIIRELSRNTRNIIEAPAQRRRGGAHSELQLLEKARTVDYFCSFYELQQMYCKTLLEFSVQQLKIVPRWFTYIPGSDRFPSIQPAPQPASVFVSQKSPTLNPTSTLTQLQPAQQDGGEPSKKQQKVEKATDQHDPVQQETPAITVKFSTP